MTITDASDPPVIGFSSLLVDDGTAEADQAAADFDLKDIIALTPKSGRDLQFTYKTEVDGNGATATGGQDYTAIDGTFTITAGQTAPSSSMFLDILDENVDEDDKQTVKVTMALVGASMACNYACGVDDSGMDFDPVQGKGRLIFEVDNKLFL